jgi:hypothetical protein
MYNLTLVETPLTSRTPEPPSYFEYYAARSLPQDKTMREFRAALGRSYLAAQLEESVRRYIQDRKGIF